MVTQQHIYILNYGQAVFVTIMLRGQDQEREWVEQSSCGSHADIRRLPISAVALSKPRVPAMCFHWVLIIE